MYFDVNGTRTYASTGGRALQNGRPWIVFLHGAGSSHLSWVLQTRALAYDGWNVLAPDMPGHNLTGGAALSDVASMTQWVLAAMESVGCEKAVICGHSMGGLIALEMARTHPERVRALVLVATAAAIPVNNALISMAETTEFKAFQSMNSWGYGADAHMHDNTWPGGSHINFGIDMMRLNAPGTLATDLKACAGYAGGADAAAQVKCPVLCIFAGQDKMTPLKAGKALADILPARELVIVTNSGHTIPTERPREVNAAMRDFLGRI